jgi:hypothetical protein
MSDVMPRRIVAMQQLHLPEIRRFPTSCSPGIGVGAGAIVRLRRRILQCRIPNLMPKSAILGTAPISALLPDAHSLSATPHRT